MTKLPRKMNKDELVAFWALRDMSPDERHIVRSFQGEESVPGPYLPPPPSAITQLWSTLLRRRLVERLPGNRYQLTEAGHMVLAALLEVSDAAPPD